MQLPETTLNIGAGGGGAGGGEGDIGGKGGEGGEGGGGVGGGKPGGFGGHEAGTATIIVNAKSEVPCPGVYTTSMLACPRHAQHLTATPASALRDKRSGAPCEPP